MAFDMRRAQEGYEVRGYSSNVHKLIVATTQHWFRDVPLNNCVFPVRDIACMFVPWEQRMNPETYKMLRFMHAVDWDKWNECIALWLSIMQRCDVEVTAAREEMVRKPMLYKQRDTMNPFEMVEYHSLEPVFVIQRINLTFDTSSISHASMFSWQVIEEEQRLARLNTVRTYLTSAVKMDFYEDLKRWHEEQYRYTQYDGRSFR